MRVVIPYQPAGHDAKDLVAMPQIVIYSGIGLSIVPAITLLFFNDDNFLREEEEEAGTSVKEGDAAGVHPTTATAFCTDASLMYTVITGLSAGSYCA